MSVLSAALIICLWQIASLAINSPLILPSFFKVLQDFFLLLGTKTFYVNLSATFLRVIESFCISLFLGTFLGFLCGRFEWCKDLLSFPVAILRATPVVALILILVFSLSSASVPVAAAVLMTLPVIITNISEGVSQSLKNSKMNEMTRIFGFTKKQKIFYVLLPKLMPHLKSSVLSSFGMTWKVVAAGEILSLPKRALGSELAKA
ncbi:MAG: ABC transporter permease subunit, partial [Treponema sp.]|nr:ABC transporter permease subunit [Treponema sp.]